MSVVRSKRIAIRLRSCCRYEVYMWYTYTELSLKVRSSSELLYRLTTTAEVNILAKTATRRYHDNVRFGLLPPYFYVHRNAEETVLRISANLYPDRQGLGFGGVAKPTNVSQTWYHHGVVGCPSIDY
jgi:hypothetical protein